MENFRAKHGLNFSALDIFVSVIQVFTIYMFYIKMMFIVNLGFNWIPSGCQNCHAGPGGNSLVCGDATARDTSIAFEMTFRLYFVKKGKIEFSYKKDSIRERDGWISGAFSVFMNDISILDDNNLMDDPMEWKHFSIDVFPGMKEISFVYQKYNSDMNSMMQLELKVSTFQLNRSIGSKSIWN